MKFHFLSLGAAQDNIRSTAPQMNFRNSMILYNNEWVLTNGTDFNSFIDKKLQIPKIYHLFFVNFLLDVIFVRVNNVTLGTLVVGNEY